MNRKNPYYGFIRKMGFDEIFSVQNGKFMPTTVLSIYKEQKITVSDVLKTASYLNDFIKANFDVKDTKYSKALFFLKTINLVFNNHNTKKPTKECVHYAVDVFHEIADMQASCSMERRANAQTAFTLNAMIDFFIC